jgi:hypothetical protein
MTEAMTIEAAAQDCPAILAEHPAKGCSEKYEFISTRAVIEPLLERKWAITSAAMQKGAAGIYGAHLITLTNPCLPTIKDEGDFNVVLVNSHDRTRRLGFWIGFYRLVCRNGLVVGNGLGRYSSLHLDGKITPERFIEAITTAADMSARLVPRVERYMERTLSGIEQLNLAERMLELRYGKLPPSISPQAALIPRRSVDEGASLWRVFNRVQENLVRGVVDGERRSRPMSSLAEGLRLNTRGWDVMDSFITVE